ncbi:STAS domain-containing protein [Amycolatopsis sp. NPDC024027]|uniref:STAS domain-containing protein n=1 Tax=Amycolatopsis sp. NPDC024027 TaxID=3154327 RepID=UPI0033EF5A06
MHDRFDLTAAKEMSKMALPRPREPDALRPRATVEVSRADAVTVLTARGELDSAITGPLADLLTGEFERRPQGLILDASAVTFCSARALAILVNAGAEAHAAGVPLAIVTRQRAILRPATALGLERVLPVHGDLADALEHLARVSP